MAKNAKTELTMDELDRAEARMINELTDAELESIAGGKDVQGGGGRPRPRPFPRPRPWPPRR
jgi:hypothetical protein